MSKELIIRNRENVDEIAYKRDEKQFEHNDLEIIKNCENSFSREPIMLLKSLVDMVILRIEVFGFQKTKLESDVKMKDQTLKSLLNMDHTTKVELFKINIDQLNETIIM